MTRPPHAAERPIIFSAPMVRAILDGRKSQARVVLKPQPPPGVAGAGRFGRTDGHGGYWKDEWSWLTGDQTDVDTVGFAGDFRTGFVEGMRLWVRETWSSPYRYSDVPPRGCGGPFWYWADGNPDDGDWSAPRASIHMPRWASRITLRVTSVRVQRLSEISEDDARAEGTGDVEGFARAWDDIHKPGARWDDDPWVVAITFERFAR